MKRRERIRKDEKDTREEKPDENDKKKNTSDMPHAGNTQDHEVKSKWKMTPKKKTKNQM